MRGTASVVMDRGVMTTIGAFACLAILALAGCVILPLPVPPTGTAVDSEVADFDIGSTTRAEVRRTFGEPNIFASDQFDIWRLERDPAHLWALVAFGGPGGVTGAEMRTGGSFSYRVAVAYDADGKVSGWRWSRSSDGQGAASPGAAIAMPFEPVRTVPWSADWVLPSSDDEVVLIDTRHGGRLETTSVSVIDGARASTRVGPSGECGLPEPSGWFGRDRRFGWLEGELISVPRYLKPEALPCRWRASADGRFGGLPTGLFPGAAPSRPARLAGDLVVVGNREGGIDILDLAGEPLATIADSLSISGVAADSASRRILLLLGISNHEFILWLFDRARGVARPLEDIPIHLPSGVTVPASAALSPDGALAAIWLGTHVEIWRLPDAGQKAVLLATLSIPLVYTPRELAFSADGRRLVAAAPGIIVWRTADWRIEAFLGGIGALSLGSNIAPTSNGAGMATTKGFWQLVRSEAEEPGALSNR